MNGNNPYAGAPGVVDAGRPEEVDLTADQKDALRQAVATIVTRTESYLPDGYAVGSELSYGTNRRLRRERADRVSPRRRPRGSQ